MSGVDPESEATRLGPRRRSDARERDDSDANLGPHRAPGPAAGRADPDARIAALWRRRSRDPFVRGSLITAALGVTAGFVVADASPAELLSPRRLDALGRFLHELVPFPLRDRAFGWLDLADWVAAGVARRGAAATAQTVSIAVASIVAAGAAALVAAALSARSLARADVAAGTGTTLWRASVAVCVRTLLAAIRAIPEYVLAFLLLAALGPSAWPAVIALALHNTGVLGRLYAEVLEDADMRSAIALAGAGAGRRHILAFDLLPRALPRMLMFLLYRFETCVREATVLGMLGVASLGLWIEDARTRMQYDNLLLYVALGVGVVLVTELLSSIVRARLALGSGAERA